MKNKHDSLTIQEILEAFPNECKTILPREIRRIRKELKPWYEYLKSIVDGGYDYFTYNFFMNMSAHYRPSDKISLLKHLESIKEAMDIPKDGQITPQMIAKAKERQILPLYDFQRVRPGVKRWSASCPWHSDRNPSFVVYNGNSFHCFSCQKSGDTIAFYMAISGANFQQAVRFLASGE